MYGTQFFVPPDMNRVEFEEDFKAAFPGGQAKFIDLVPDAHNGQKLYELWIPLDRKDEIMPWLAAWCERHGAELETKPSNSGFSWSHSG